MSKKATIVYQGRAVTLHFNSRFARFCGMGSPNCAVTISAKHILVSRDWITRHTLAHEFGHVILQAEPWGIFYLPRVLLSYCLALSYRRAKVERDADTFMDQHYAEFSDYGDIPTWVRRR